MNNVAEKLPSLPPLMLLSTLLPRCLVCFAAQNIWTGCRAVSLLRHYYVYFKWHVQLRKGYFCSQVASLRWILFCLGKADRV